MIKLNVYIWLFVHFLNCIVVIEMFEIKDVITIEQNNIIAVLESLPNEFEISFEVYFTSFLDQWSNVIRFTIGGDVDTYGDRIFSFFILNTLIQFSASINGETDYIIRFLPLFNLMEWNKVSVSQFLENGVYNFVIKKDGVIITTLQNNNVQPFEHVRVYASDPWHLAQPGYIRNLIVTNINTMPFFAINSETVLRTANYLTTIKTLQKEYEITFEAFFTSYIPNVWSDVLHLDCNSERVYEISILNTLLHAWASVNNNALYGVPVKTYNLNEWITFYVRQSLINGYYTHTVQINRITVNMLQNTGAKVFQNVTVYAPIYTAQPGFLRNLLVINACPICDLLPTLSTNSYVSEEVYLHVNLATNPECYSYLQNVKIVLQAESLFNLKRFFWNDSSLNDSNVQGNGKTFIVNVKKITRNMYVTFSVSFVYDKNVVEKKSSASIIVNFRWNYFCEDPVVKNKNQAVLISLKGSISPGKKLSVNKISSTWIYNQPNGTLMLSETHQFVCQTMQKRQSSPCYQREISSGVISFLPIQVMEVIGYDSNTTLVYGLTTRKNFIEIDISKKKNIFITKERCLKIPACEKFLSLK
ncbi:uncharacterized protein LOC124812192 [Hydra vulgaris]|uniref:uncharacterized protein LOC124812192 n=1 Tax=Hydra vulgaris TaxID=6087 RepID=UPI001F5EF4A1|nr:uncharacterized protein LOC124812192 [Hydra vulgaris]